MSPIHATLPQLNLVDKNAPCYYYYYVLQDAQRRPEAVCAGLAQLVPARISKAAAQRHSSAQLHEVDMSVVSAKVAVEELGAEKQLDAPIRIDRRPL